MNVKNVWPETESCIECDRDGDPNTFDLELINGEWICAVCIAEHEADRQKMRQP